jgi:hypothetical protein
MIGEGISVMMRINYENLIKRQTLLFEFGKYYCSEFEHQFLTHQVKKYKNEK